MTVAVIQSCALSDLPGFDTHAQIHLLDAAGQPDQETQDRLTLHFDPQPHGYAEMEPLEQGFFHLLSDAQIAQMHRFVFRLVMDLRDHTLIVACQNDMTRAPTLAAYLSERFQVPLRHPARRLDHDLLARLRAGGTPFHEDLPKP